MKLEIDSINYKIPLTALQWDTLNSIDFDVIVNAMRDTIDTRTIEFNGHYGMYFFFNKPNDQKVAKKVIRILGKLLRENA